MPETTGEPTGVPQRRLDGSPVAPGVFTPLALDRDAEAQQRAASTAALVKVLKDHADTEVSWHLPHHGDPTERCGRWEWFAHYAPNGKYHGRAHQHDCHRFECPECRCELDDRGNITKARGWENRAAIDIRDRIALAAISKVERGRPGHVVVSPPQEAAKAAIKTIFGYRKQKALALKMLKRAGMRGGCLIFHEKRLPSRWNDKKRCVDGPHWHALGFGWIETRWTSKCRSCGAVRRQACHDDGKLRTKPHDGRGLYNETGWVVRNLGPRRDVLRTALYLLSHASRPKSGYPAFPRGTSGKDSREVRPPSDEDDEKYEALAVTWWGTLSYNKLGKMDEDELDSGPTCSICAKKVPTAEWMPAEYAGDDPLRPPDDDRKSFELEPGTGWRVLQARYWDRYMREEWAEV